MPSRMRRAQKSPYPSTELTGTVDPSLEGRCLWAMVGAAVSTPFVFHTSNKHRRAARRAGALSHVRCLTTEMTPVNADAEVRSTLVRSANQMQRRWEAVVGNRFSGRGWRQVSVVSHVQHCAK